MPTDLLQVNPNRVYCMSNHTYRSKQKSDNSSRKKIRSIDSNLLTLSFIPISFLPSFPNASTISFPYFYNQIPLLKRPFENCHE